MSYQPGNPGSARPAIRRLGAALDWFFRSRRTQQITIVQFPNLPLAVFLVSVGLGWVTSAHSTTNSIARGIGTGALAWWSIDEILRGVNPWRRVLGAFGFTFVVFRLVALAQ